MSAGLPVQPVAVRAAREFFAHSGHVPLVLLILEALLAQPGYFAGPDPYVLLAAGMVQAWLTALLERRGQARRLLANLAGPLLYTAVEAALEGGAFFGQWHHQAYWAYAIAFGLLQSVPRAPFAAVIAENVLRSSIPLVMYALFEARLAAASAPALAAFFADRAHAFLAVVLLLLGVLLGFADVALRRSLATIAQLNARLRRYSEWSLGGGLLERAMADERVLALQRVERAVIFMDIRGFTAWSERQAPEQVVDMLNRYYAASEQAASPSAPIRLKFTADEVMAVFADAGAAMAAARAMLGAAMCLLAPAGLAAGAGVHYGPLVEGVLGGESSRAYEFIGDTVNTAQRLCDAAAPGELLASAKACAAAGIGMQARREVRAKGKSEPLDASVVTIAA
jgi:adenylate cyclase